MATCLGLLLDLKAARNTNLALQVSSSVCPSKTGACDFLPLVNKAVQNLYSGERSSSIVSIIVFLYKYIFRKSSVHRLSSFIILNHLKSCVVIFRVVLRPPSSSSDPSEVLLICLRSLSSSHPNPRTLLQSLRNPCRRLTIRSKRVLQNPRASSNSLHPLAESLHTALDQRHSQTTCTMHDPFPSSPFDGAWSADFYSKIRLLCAHGIFISRETF